jgi:cytochrome c-type biogenesis protein CcmH/NrfF
MRRLAWLGLGVVVLVALVVGVTDRTPATDEQRAHNIGKTIMCPACSGETVTDSQAPVAVNIRRQIAERVFLVTDARKRMAEVDMKAPASGYGKFKLMRTTTDSQWMLFLNKENIMLYNRKGKRVRAKFTEW